MKTAKRQTKDTMKPKSRLSNGKAKVSVQPMVSLPSTAAVCKELRALQRHRAVFIKSRIMVANRLQAIVAGTLGYHSGMDEKDRIKKMTEAGKLIKAISKNEIASDIHSLVMTHLIGIEEFNRMISEVEKQMLKQVEFLPVAKWVKQPEQRGFGPLMLAIIIGETGGLSDYANPGKLWRRMGCAPWSFGGKTQMGATWKSGKEGKLPAEQWETFGYSPRRRSIAYLIGEGIVKQNMVAMGAVIRGETETHAGPYRRRYDEAKKLISTVHPDYPKLRCHYHGMLLATKLLLKNLWIEWNRKP